MPGDLFPVNSIGERYIEGLFVRNNRVTFNLETAQFGRITLVMVGATIVGRIGVCALDDASPPPGVTELNPVPTLNKGDELGVFHLGSTVVLLFEPGVELRRQTGPIRYGESLLRAL
jgi:phosphatidylserine decarboxylase